MKKISYIANARIPTEKAHGIQIMKTCEAPAREGADVTLVVPERKTHIEEDSFSYYGVEKNFAIKKLWCFDTVRFGWLGFWIQQLTFAERVAWYALFKDDMFYTRDEFLAFYLKILGKKVVWEAHMGQANVFVRSLVRLRIPMVVISQGLKDLYVSMGVDEDNVLVAPDAVDLKRFDIAETKEEVREKLGIDKGKKIAMYTGSKQSWKGVDTLEEAGKLMPEVEVMIVSGKPHKKMPLYLRSADVLVLPNSAKEEISRSYTSPMKLFEYMASGVPIVASDLPSIREVLDESTAYFFNPDDAESLANTIDRVLSEQAAALKKAEKAKEEVKKHTWKARAEKILGFI